MDGWMGGCLNSDRIIYKLNISLFYIIICNSNVIEKIIIIGLWQRNPHLEVELPPLAKGTSVKRKHTAADGCDIRIIQEKIG